MRYTLFPQLNSTLICINSIIATLLGRLRMGIEDCIEFYRDSLIGEIFAHEQFFHRLRQHKYDKQKLEALIKDVVSRVDPEEPGLVDPKFFNKSGASKADMLRNRLAECRV